MQKIGFVGGGRIVRIFLQSIQNKKRTVEQIIVSDPDSEAVKKLTAAFPELNVTVGTNMDAAAQEFVFLAVHPPILKSVLSEIAATVQNAKAVISLAPVFNAERISSMLTGYNKIVRMIPNAATIMNTGYNPVWFSEYIGKTEKNLLIRFFQIFGECPEVEEEKLEAYAIITAMGPTYLWPQLNELHRLSMEFGLTEQETLAGMKAMATNTIELLYDSDMSYDQVVDLIPVKPLNESELDMRNMYNMKLTTLYKKLKGN